MAALAPLGIRRSLTKISDDEVFRENGKWIDTRLRRRVLKSGRLPYVCETCSNPGEHRGKPLVLHLDHRNGNHRDCRWENLRWLCPNCHSQTPTYARTTVVPNPDLAKSPQLSLGLSIERTRSYPMKRKIDHDLVRTTYAEKGTYRSTAIVLGISDMAVKKIVTDSGWKKP